MLPLKEENREEHIEFSWGYKKRVGGPNKDIHYYESFTYDGVEYFLYDCVYIWHDREPEPYIGKLVKIWESPSHKKIAKVVWFFRPIEIQSWLEDIEPLGNEIFLASGEGKGLYNLNCLEAISGKCNVVCTSKDKRNPQAPGEELRMADYIFYRTFDVGNCKISDKFADMIAGHEVGHFFNQRKDQRLSGHPDIKAQLKDGGVLSNSSSKFEVLRAVNNVKDGHSGRSTNPAEKELKIAAARFSKLTSASASDVRPLKKRKLQSTSIPNPVPCFPEHKVNLLDLKDSLSEKRGLPKGVNFDEKANMIPDKGVGQCEQHKGVKTQSQIPVGTKRPDVDKSNWFKQQSLDERMQSAHEKGTLVLLENLDPSFTSLEVEDMVMHAFNIKVSAKMIQCSTFSSPYCGQAFVIFNSKDAAEFAISELNKKCLILGGGRPVIGRRGTLREPGNPSKFVGHLIIDKIRLQKQREETRNAVSTSHYSQPNTIEYEMAIEWRALQEKSNLWWDALHKQHAKEIENLRSQFKTQYKE